MLSPYPLVSVIMHVYNSSEYLIESIESILNQTFRNFELIIINDGSTDESEKIIKSYADKRIVFFIQENKGLASTLNRGINQARGNWIARMDADNISYPNRLEEQLKFLINNKACVAVGSNADYVDRMVHIFIVLKNH